MTNHEVFSVNSIYIYLYMEFTGCSHDHDLGNLIHFFHFCICISLIQISVGLLEFYSRNIRTHMSATVSKNHVKFPNYRILFLVPNIIGYVRVILLVAAWQHIDTDPMLFLVVYVSSVILDAVDGFTARKLNQTSSFGAWFDVVIDNIGRGMLWTFSYKWGYFVSALEWLVFVCTHTYGPSWKTSGCETPPFWVKAVMANNFKTILGSHVIAGLHILPVWFYALQKLEIVYKHLGSQAVAIITTVLVSGRLTCCLVEAWFVWIHIKALLTNYDNHDP